MGKPTRATYPTEQPLIPVIAIPTTYAGSEMTPVYGVTYTTGDAGRKVTVKDIKIAPKLMLYDPALTLSLPPNVTAGTGINALAHCIEALYSTTRHPLATAAALEGICYITRALPVCYANGAGLAARTEVLAGAHLAGAALATVNMAIHHGLCHILGGIVRVPHGIANAVMLPHAMRFNLDVAAPELARAAEAMGLGRENKTDAQMAQAGIEYVEKLIRGLGLLQRLRDAGATEYSILGPFHRTDAPELPLGSNMAGDIEGEPVVVRGRVLAPDGGPIPNAALDVWQSDAEGHYDLQMPDLEGTALHAIFQADAEGRFVFRTIKPSFYPIPYDGPVGQMLVATRRHPYRPAHIHFIVSADGYRSVTTALFAEGDPYLDSDTVFGVRRSLVVPFVHHDSADEAARLNVSAPFYTVEYDFVLEPA